MDKTKYNEGKDALQELEAIKQKIFALKNKFLKADITDPLVIKQRNDEINKLFDELKSAVWECVNEFTDYPELFVEEIKRLQNDFWRAEMSGDEQTEEFVKTAIFPEKTGERAFYFEAIDSDGVRKAFKEDVSNIARQFSNYSYEEYAAHARSVGEIIHLASEMIAQKSGVRQYELLSQVKDFMDQDLQLKKKMADLAPHVFFKSMSETVKMHSGVDKYAEALEDLLQDAYRAVSLSMKMVGGSQEDVDKAFENMHYQLNKCYSPNPDTYEYNLHNFYRNCVSSMSLDFEKRVKENLIGYYMMRNFGIVRGAGSINELLHVAHAAITNTEDMYYNLPEVVEKVSSFNTRFGERSESVLVLGEDTEFARKLSGAFAALQSLQDPARRAGMTTIMSFGENSACVMIRDLGHATVFSFSPTEDGKVRMEYSIPKVCNKDMIMCLPNVSYQDDMTYAHGSIECEPSEIYQQAMEVAYNIPSDLDMGVDRSERGFKGIEDVINDLSKEGLQCLIDEDLTKNLVINQNKVNVQKFKSPQVPDVELDFGSDGKGGEEDHERK